MKAGFVGSASILAIASSSVPSALGLAGLSKPIWLSEICTKEKPVAAACASPMSFAPGTPPESVHTSPVPPQAMHSSACRRSMPLPFRSLSIFASCRRPAPVIGGDLGRGGFIPRRVRRS